jgi:hypothetical protein
MIRNAFVCFTILATSYLCAEPVVLQSQFDSSVGPNAYEVNFPPELGGGTLFMPIVGGTFDLETDAEAGTSRILAWSQNISPIDIFGMSTGPITVTIDPGSESSGTFEPSSSHFQVSARFLISFDDTALSQVGFFSPIALEGTEDGNIYGVGSIGSIHMFLTGGGAVAGSSFSYTCHTSAKFQYLLDESQGQPGDVNHDRTIDLSDPVAILNTLFLGGSAACPSAAEVNSDGRTDVSDAVYLLSYLFQGGSAPPAEPVSCDLPD